MKEAKTLNDVLSSITKSITDFRSDMNTRFDLVDQRFDGVDKRLDGMDERFDGIDQKFAGIDQRFDRLEVKVDRLDESLDEVAIYAIKTHEIVEQLSSRSQKPRAAYHRA